MYTLWYYYSALQSILNCWNFGQSALHKVGIQPIQEQVFVLAKQIGINLNIDTVEGLNDELDGGHSDNGNKPSEDQKAVELGSTLV